MARSDNIPLRFRLPRPVSERLEQAARGPGVYKSDIVRDALTAWLDRKGSDELDLRFAKRLDRISNQLARIERNGRIELESLALFVRYMLAVNAPLPEEDEASRAIARDRFTAFVDRVARQVAGGRLSFLPEEDDR
jgi:Arc/MetJ-type ribon-helix-helix transcriptional regulator